MHAEASGWRFAVLELKIAILSLIDAFEFQPSVSIASSPGFTTRPVVAGDPKAGTQLPLQVSLAA